MCVEPTMCSGALDGSDAPYGFSNALGSGTLPGPRRLSLVNIIDQSPK